MRDWFASLSWRGPFIYFALTFGLLFWVTGGSVYQPASPAGFTPSILGGVLFSAFATPLTMRRRHRANPTNRPPLPIDIALREGKPPGLINPDFWLPALKARAAADRSLRRASILLLVIGALIPLFSIGSQNWTGLTIISVLMIVVGVWRVITAQVELPKIAKLDADIRAAYRVEPDAEPERQSS